MKIFISENIIQEVHNLRVKDIIRKYSQLIKHNGVGYKGKLEKNDLIDGSYFEDSAKKILDFDEFSDDNDDEDFSESLEKKFKNDFFYNIWKNYVKALERKRAGTELSIFRFAAMFLDNDDVECFIVDDSVIIGRYNNGFFKPTHFAPINLKGGVNAIRELIKYDNIVFAVTSDLAEMLIKMGAYFDPKLQIPMIFRDMFVTKKIIFTNPDIMSEVLFNLKNYKNMLNLDYDDLKPNYKKNSEKYEKYDPSLN